MTKICPIDVDTMIDGWPLIKPFIENAVEYADNKFSVSSVFNDIRSGYYKLWVVYNESHVTGCFVSELLQYPCSRRMAIPFLSCDDFDVDMLPHFEAFKQYAKDNGATSIEIFGRTGWERRLKPMGFEKTHTVMRLEI